MRFSFSFSLRHEKIVIFHLAMPWMWILCIVLCMVARSNLNKWSHFEWWWWISKSLSSIITLEVWSLVSSVHAVGEEDKNKKQKKEEKKSFALVGCPNGLTDFPPLGMPVIMFYLFSSTAWGMSLHDLGTFACIVSPRGFLFLYFIQWNSFM